MTEKKGTASVAGKSSLARKAAYIAANKYKGTLVPNGISDLSNVIFDDEGKGTDFQKNLEKIGTYIGQRMDFGGDMNVAIVNQKMVVIPVPDRPIDVTDVFEMQEWKVEYNSYVNHRKNIEA